MATYKVIQDIEAEDKFLGPLTLKQFIFGMAGMFFGWLCFFSVMKGFPWACTVFAPPMLLGVFMAVPWSKDQPTEVWVLAKLKFMFQPRRKVWDQSGMEELVTITAPKVENKPLVDNLSKTEVKSRLKVLAQTIDSRGWAVKNSQLDDALASQRLISPTTLPQEVPIIDVNTIPDVLDESYTTSENFDRMINQSTELRKQQNLDKLDRIRRGEPLEAVQNVAPPSPAITAPTTDYQLFTQAQANQQAAQAEEERLLNEQLKSRQTPDVATSHMRTLNPVDYTYAPQQNAQPTYSNHIDNPTDIRPTNQALSRDNDKNIETLARVAEEENKDDGEVVISLH